MVAHFKTDLARGQFHERRVLQFLRDNGYTAELATPEMQVKGIDIYGEDDNGDHFTIEVKADSRSHETGNAFIELHHRGWQGETPGWAKICQANWVLYLVLKPEGPDEGLLIRPQEIAKNLVHWTMRYRMATVKNPPRKQRGQHTATSWETKGVLVPLTKIREIAEIIYLDHERSP